MEICGGIMEENNNEFIGYKIMAGHKYRVFKKEFNGNVFYNIQIQQKQYDEQIIKFYRPVTFKKGVVLDDPDGKGIDIIIHKGYENLRVNKNVDEKNQPYCPITSILITDFTICEREEQKQSQAYQKYQDILSENETEDKEVVIDDNMLPF